MTRTTVGEAVEASGCELLFSSPAKKSLFLVFLIFFVFFVFLTFLTSFYLFVVFVEFVKEFYKL